MPGLKSNTSFIFANATQFTRLIGFTEKVRFEERTVYKPAKSQPLGYKKKKTLLFKFR